MPGLFGTDNNSSPSPRRTRSSPLIRIHSSNSSILTRNNNSSSSLHIPNPVSLVHTILLLTRHILQCPRYLLTLSPWSLPPTSLVLIPSVLESVSLRCMHRRLLRRPRLPLIVLKITNNTTISTPSILLLLNTRLSPWTRADGFSTTSLILISTTHTTNNPSLCSSCGLSRAGTISPTLPRLPRTLGNR
jgi:hypothetical protein